MFRLHSLNVLIAGKGELIPLIRSSKLLNNLYVTSEEDVEGAESIRFNTFKELAIKCKSLQIDIVIVENEMWILQGIADVLRKNFVNCIAPVSRWAEITISNKQAKELLDKYNVANPSVLSFPNCFPVNLRADKICMTANSMKELIKFRQELNTYPDEIIKTAFLEECIEGMKVSLTSLFDGRNLISFPVQDLTDTQQLKLDEYSRKLEYMFNSEKAEFIGFISSELIWSGNEWYNQGFGLKFPKPDIDILYILVSAIYQKLNEIKI